MYRVFVSAPGDLERDREACHEAIAKTNEAIAMPARILLVTVGLRENDHISGNRGIISDNVRWSAFFIQIFEDDWGPRDLFRKLFLLAAECRDDASMPMREVVVCLKDAPNETNPEVLAFRKELEDRNDLRIIRYRQAEELRDRLVDVCNEWTRALIDSGAHSPMVTGT
ncbi:MAG: hypothetical protein ABR976_10070 [Terracidiphilus sp.]|jgi:hypothetical protein